MSRPQHSCAFHKHSNTNGSFTNLETTPLLLLHQTALTLFVEPKAEDPLTAQTLHQIAHDIHEFGIIKERLNWFLIYIMSILLYLGLNATLLVANSMPQTFIEEYYELPMHYLSFWGVFGFTVVEAVLLLSTSLVSLERRLASSLLFLDVCLSFGSALLYSLDPDIFEVPAHYAEYIVQILITSVNFYLSKIVNASSRKYWCKTRGRTRARTSMTPPRLLSAARGQYFNPPYSHWNRDPLTSPWC
jgi:hypothetical protein